MNQEQGIFVPEWLMITDLSLGAKLMAAMLMDHPNSTCEVFSYGPDDQTSLDELWANESVVQEMKKSSAVFRRFAEGRDR